MQTLTTKEKPTAITSLLEVGPGNNTTVDSYNFDVCTCQSDSVSSKVYIKTNTTKLEYFQMQVGIGFLWSLVSLNWVLIACLTLWWWSILKNNDHFRIAEEEEYVTDKASAAK
jgi:hypothetical protein